ncbi:MAG: hypothetical protein Q7S16_00070 [bacterium]|nr:hypothetical protein [bacterium]
MARHSSRYKQEMARHSLAPQFSMEVLIGWLHSLTLVIPGVTLLYLWYKRKGIEIDHIFLFTLGFIFYLILPFTLAETELFSANLGVYPTWKRAFDAITPQTWVWYFISVLLFYGSFIAGSWMSSKRSLPAVKIKNDIDPTALNIFFVIALFFIFVFGYSLRGYFFFAYQKSTQIPVFDSFIAASILLMSVAVCATIRRYYKRKEGQSLWKLLFNPAVISYCIVAVLLISMGGRVIVGSSLIMVAVFFSVYIRRIHPLAAIAIFIALILSSHVVSMWRIGVSMQDTFAIQEYFVLRGWLMAATVFSSENFNVGYSLIDFLGKYSLPILRFPLVLFSNLIGLIPSFLFPAKTSWMVGFTSLGYNVGGLSGGFNAYISLVVNFGILGASLFLFGLSYVLQQLKHYSGPIATAVYVMLSGWLAALFFRNFEQTVIKQMLEFSVLMPLALLVVSRILMKRKEKLLHRQL